MDDSLKNAILKNKELAAALKEVLADLIPQLVRYNSVMFTGATDPVIAQEMNAGVIVTSDLYQLAEALNAAAVNKPVHKSRNKKAKELENVPQHLEHEALIVGEPTDSDKTS